MRGKAVYAEDASAQAGITPAYAGKSFVGQLHELVAQDHPRVCGEKLGNANITVQNQGSPPRMRGKGLPLPRSDSPAGITPAYAGKRSC